MARSINFDAAVSFNLKTEHSFNRDLHFVIAAEVSIVRIATDSAIAIVVGLA